MQVRHADVLVQADRFRMTDNSPEDVASDSIRNDNNGFLLLLHPAIKTLLKLRSTH
jgi:hypothetical protein